MPGTAFNSANWSGYDEATVTNPGAALTAFTLLIDVSTLSASWKAAVQSDGADIRVTKGDNTELAYDLINWAYNAGAPTGWIRACWAGTLASSGTQKVRIWADYTPGTAVAYDATETYGKNNAYDANWAGYWPLYEASGSAVDRTANGRNATFQGALPDAAAGQVGLAQKIDATTDYVSVARTGLAVGAFSVLLWNYTNNTGDGRITAGQSRGNPSQRDFDIFDNGTNMFFVGTDGAANLWSASAGSPATGAWEHLSGTWDGTTGANGAKLFRAGSLLAQATASGTALATGNQINMAGVGASSLASGYIDDVQIHSVARAAEWIAEEYAQSNSQATFWGTWAWTSAIVSRCYIIGDGVGGRIIGG